MERDGEAEFFDMRPKAREAAAQDTPRPEPPRLQAPFPDAALALSKQKFEPGDLVWYDDDSSELMWPGRIEKRSDEHAFYRIYAFGDASYKVPFSVRVEAYECADAGRYWAALEAELEPKRTQQLRADADRAAKRAAEGPLAHLETSTKRSRGAEGSAALLGKQRARRARPFFGARGGVSTRHAESPLIPRHAGGDEDNSTHVTTAGHPAIELDKTRCKGLGTNDASPRPPPAALSMEMQPLRVLSILATAEVPSQNASTAPKPHTAPASTSVAPALEATALPSGVQDGPRPAATALPPGSPVEPQPTMALPPGSPVEPRPIMALPPGSHPSEGTTDSTTSTTSIPTVRAGHVASTTSATPAIQSGIDPASSGEPALHTGAPPSVSVDAQLDARVKYLNQLVRVRRELAVLVRLLAAASANEQAGRLPAPVPEGAAYTLAGISASLFAIRPWEAPSSEQERFEAIVRKIRDEEAEHVQHVRDLVRRVNKLNA